MQIQQRFLHWQTLGQAPLNLKPRVNCCGDNFIYSIDGNSMILSTTFPKTVNSKAETVEKT